MNAFYVTSVLPCAAKADITADNFAVDAEGPFLNNWYIVFMYICMINIANAES